MVTVSEQLRRARESQKLDIYQVAEITKIKTDHIRALETGDFDVFSAPVYIRGFVRSYASMLKLDVPKVISDLDEELSQSEKFAEPPPLSPRSIGVFDFLTLWLSRLNWRISVAVASGFIDETLRAQAEGAGVQELIFKANAVEDLCDAFVRLAQTVAKKSAGG